MKAANAEMEQHGLHEAHAASSWPTDRGSANHLTARSS